MVGSSSGTAAAAVLKIVGAGPDVDVILGRETGAGRGAVGRVAGRVRALRRGETHASGGAAGSTGRGGHSRAVAAPVQPDTVHVLRRRIHRMYLGRRLRVPLNRTRDLHPKKSFVNFYLVSCLSIDEIKIFLLDVSR